MTSWIPFLTALIWPLFISILLVLYRADASRMIYSLRRRLERGDKFSVGGLAIESYSTSTPPNVGIQSVATSEVVATQAEYVLVATTANKQNKVLIAASPTFRGDPLGLLGAGDMLGMAVIQAAFLRSAGMKVEVAIIRPPYIQLEGLVRDNFVFVTLGSPSGNELTRLAMTNAYTAFDFEGLTILDRTSGEHYIPTLDNTTGSGKDWGLVLSLPHPRYGVAGRAIVIAGCYGYGSQAAATVLAEIHEYDALWRLAESGCFEALIEVTIKDGHTTSIGLIKALEFGGGMAKATSAI